MGKKGDLSNFEHGMVVGARQLHGLFVVTQAPVNNPHISRLIHELRSIWTLWRRGGKKTHQRGVISFCYSCHACLKQISGVTLHNILRYAINIFAFQFET